MMHQIFLGRREDVPAFAAKESLALSSNRKLEVSFGPEFENIVRLLKLRGYSPKSIGEAKIRVSEVMFEDGTLYSGGAMYKRNPESSGPNKWLRIDQ